MQRFGAGYRDNATGGLGSSGRAPWNGKRKRNWQLLKLVKLVKLKLRKQQPVRRKNYDRALAGVSGPLLVGLAHAMQQVSCVPSEAWDIAMDFVVTDNALHRCKVETH